MDTYKLKFTRLQNEIFRLLCIKAGKALNQREIARSLRVSPTAISKAIKKIKEEGLIKVEKNQNMNLSSIQLNRDNPKSILLKRIENLKVISDSGLIDFLEEKFPGSVIILFGSYSYGEDIIDSDVDIAIIGAKEKEINLEKFENFLEKEIILHFYSSLKEINKNLKSNILNGITLMGVVEV